jgi:phage terminase small subunit
VANKRQARARSVEDKRARFAQEYAKDFNATQAAIRSGYAKKGAHVTASRLLADPDVAAQVQKILARVAAKAEITVERTQAEIAAVAYASKIPHKGNLSHKLKALDQCMSILGMHKTTPPSVGGVSLTLIMSDGKTL